MPLQAPELMEGLYASESTLHSSVAFLRNTLAGALVPPAGRRRGVAAPRHSRGPNSAAQQLRGAPSVCSASHACRVHAPPVWLLPCTLPLPHTAAAPPHRAAAGLGFCQDLNLLSTEPSDVVSTCNTIYGLLLQHQKDCKFREQLKQGGPSPGCRALSRNVLHATCAGPFLPLLPVLIFH